MASNDWGEVIMGNSPLADYIKELENNSDIDVGSILSQQIIMPEDSLADELNSLNNNNNIQNNNDNQTNIKPATSNNNNNDDTPNSNNNDNILYIIKRILSSIYHKTYFQVVGSELLHPEESIFLWEDENDDNTLNIKPDMNLESGLSLDWRLFSSSMPTKKKLSTMIGITIVFLSIFFKSPMQVQKRQETINKRIDEVIDLSKQHVNATLLKVMKAIMEVELIARGYRLSSPLSPIERLEQSSKSQKSLHMRTKATHSVLLSQKILSSTSFDCLSLLPSIFYPSYSSKLSSKESIEEINEPTLAELKSTYYQYFLDRSQFFTILLLSLLNVTNPTGSDYMTMWKNTKEMMTWQTKIDSCLTSLTHQLRHDIVDLKNCVRTEFWANRIKIHEIPKRVLLNKTHKTVQERFFQQSKDIKLSLQGIIERIALCEENINNSNNNEDIEVSKAALSQLVEHYQIVRKDLAQSLEIWDAGNILLLKIIDGLSNDDDDQQLKDLRNLIKDGPVIEQIEDITAVAMDFQPFVEPTEEQTFEAYTGPKIESDSEEDIPPPPPPVQSFVPGVIPPPPPMGLKMVSRKKPSKNRAERMAEKANKPEVSTITLPPEIEAKRMINELKDVLRIRKPTKP